MTIQTKSIIRFPTHVVVIQVKESGRIRVFKYGSSNCDFEVFDHEDSAIEYVVEPPPTEFYRVVVGGDDLEVF